MTIPLPHASEAVAGTASMTERWYDFMSRVARRLSGPVQLPKYTVAQLPPNPIDGWSVFASDAGGGGVPVYSRDGVWRRFDTNAEVS